MARRLSSIRRPPLPDSRNICGSWSSRRMRWPTDTSSARSIASAPRSPWNIGEFYGKSYFCNPRGKIIAQASRDKDEVVVADLDLDMIAEVRNTWQFFRDRRPETYEPLMAQTGRARQQIDKTSSQLSVLSSQSGQSWSSLRTELRTRRRHHAISSRHRSQSALQC